VSEKDGIGLGISGNSNTIASAMPVSSSSSSTSSLSGQEIKKGRFSVNQTPQRSYSVTTPSLEHANFITDHSTLGTAPEEGAATVAVVTMATTTVAPTPVTSLPPLFNDHQDFKSTPVSRVGSNDSLRKSRFAVHHSPMAPALEKNTFDSLPLSRNASSTACTSFTGKPSRFSVAKEDSIPKDGGVQQEPTPTLPLNDTPNSTIHSECRKKGRFQLSGVGDMKFEKDYGYMDSPQSSVSSYSPNSSFSRGQSARLFDPSANSILYSNMEYLLKQVETQKMIMCDMLAGLALQPGSQAPTSIPASFSSKASVNEVKYQDTGRPRSGSLNADISQTMVSCWKEFKGDDLTNCYLLK
jgi:hypothetical protein